jgi:putative NAD(P)-binding protein
VNTLAAARRVGFGGRFLYMTASSVTSLSWATVLLNLYKGNTLVWRERAEHEIRGSGLEYTIIRAGILLNRPGGQHALVLTQRPLPLSIRYRIARADVADVFVAALGHPRAIRATFEVVWGDGPPREKLPQLRDQVEPDECRGASLEEK